MLKRGFTLAEVLITLMIIGVVATLTTPALVKNVGSSKIGPQLSKFVNTWETASETMMMDENISTVNYGQTFGPGGMRRLSKYMIMTSLKGLKSPSSIDINNANGGSVYSEPLAGDRVWQLKDGTIVIVDPKKMPSGWSYTGSGAYKEALTPILVDIGGMKGSHRVGKEVFAFIIDSSGVLVPYGSNAHKSMSQGFSTDCANSSTNYDRALACTGAVADNGWKAPW